MSNYPQKALNWTLDVIFPKICVGCGYFTESSDFTYLCRGCFGKIEIKNTLECVGCKRETKFGLTCVPCRKDNPLDQLLISADLSNDLVSEMVKVYKYKFITDMALPLTVMAKKSVKKLLNKGFNLFEDDPLIVPVPLHKKRLNWRGFNQAELLAKNLADVYHVSYGADVLRRVSNPKHQADIRLRQERLNNAKNNFAIVDAEAVSGRTIILVDDICTTGATLNECARVLKSPPAGGGAKRVIGFVIARGQFKSN